MSEEELLTLTFDNSHKKISDPYWGSFSIGTKDYSKGEYNVLVKLDSVINWDIFNKYYIQASLKEKEKHPYGDWPRFFTYSGNDVGFIKWSKKRVIEDFYWNPLKDMQVDFTDACIYTLRIESDNKIELLLGSNIDHLVLYSNLENYKIISCKKVPSLKFIPTYDNQIASYKLPLYESLKNAKMIEIEVHPNDPPFDCVSLLQFSKVETLYLIGNMTNLEVLKKLKNLKTLGLWDMKDLSNFPNLNSWTNLDDFVAVNIDENVGKRLRIEGRELKKQGKFKKFFSVVKLRNKEWFETNCGIPFTYWEGKNSRKAMIIYNKFLKKVNEAMNEEEIKNAVIEYTKKFNNLEDIESTERDDIYTALCNVMNNSKIKIKQEKWELWFEKIRNF